MDIGDKLLLMNLSEYVSDKDITFIQVVIAEKRDDVTGMWGGKMHTGYKAKDKADNIYELNWYSFPDDSPTPSYQWWCPTKRNFAYWATGKYFPSELAKKLVRKYNFVKFCKKHSLLVMKSTGCWKDSLPDEPIVEKPPAPVQKVRFA